MKRKSGACGQVKIRESGKNTPAAGGKEDGGGQCVYFRLSLLTF
ncbi:hypothetical protein [Parabacteroides acidifaciens]|nr:hypothetical protein [Parabacteroides acidifaciens]